MVAKARKDGIVEVVELARDMEKGSCRSFNVTLAFFVKGGFAS